MEIVIASIICSIITSIVTSLVVTRESMSIIQKAVDHLLDVNMDFVTDVMASQKSQKNEENKEKEDD